MGKITIGLNSAVPWIIKCTPDLVIGDLGYNFKFEGEAVRRL